MSGFKGLVRKDKSPVTVEYLKSIFPNKKSTITHEIADMVHAANMSDDFNGDEFIDTLVTYRDVMSKGAYSVKDYVTAVKFCAYLIAENDNTLEAYKKARAGDEFVMSKIDAAPGTQDYNTLSSAASRYRQSKLVKELLTTSQMPLYLMFQGERYRAVEVLAREMQEAAYSKDRISAADKLLTHVKPPENLQVELEIGPNQEALDLGAELSKQLAASVAMQRALLERGADLKEATKLGISLNDTIDVEVEER